MAGEVRRVEDDEVDYESFRVTKAPDATHDSSVSEISPEEHETWVRDETEKVLDCRPDKGEFGLFWGAALFESAGEYKALVDKIINYGDVVCIAAEKKVGKTVFVQQLAAQLTTGGYFLDVFKIDKPCNVLYIQSEGNRGSTQRRLRAIEKSIPLDAGRFFHLNIAGASLQSKFGSEAVINSAIKACVKYDVIIFDPLYSLMHGGDMNSSKDATMWTNNVRKILGLFEATGIVVHHESEKEYMDRDGNKHKTAKLDSLFGSSVWGYFFSNCFKLTYSKKEKVHKLTMAFDREGDTIQEVVMKMVTPQEDPLGRLFYKAIDGGDVVVKADVKITQVLAANTAGMTAREIAEACGISEVHFYRLIKELESTGTVEKLKGDRTLFALKRMKGAG